jgi:hypothetical protein
MGMFDIIQGAEVKCFECELKSYKLGDTVPCDIFSYSGNLLIMPFNTLLSEFWKQLDFVIIKDSKVFGLKTICDLKDSDFDDIDEVITYMGDKINISNRNELLEYVEDIMILKVKNEMNDLRSVENYDYYEDFEKKWK